MNFIAHTQQITPHFIAYQPDIFQRLQWHFFTIISGNLTFLSVNPAGFYELNYSLIWHLLIAKHLATRVLIDIRVSILQVWVGVVSSWTNTLPTLTCWLEGSRERESGTCDWRPLTRFIVYWYLSSYLDWGSLTGAVCGRAGRRLWNIREPVLCGLCCNVKHLVVWFDGQVRMSRSAISDRNKMTKKLEYLNFEGFRIWRGISLLRPFFSSTFSLCDHGSINYI